MRGVSWYEPVANLLLIRLAIGVIETILKGSMTRPLAPVNRGMPRAYRSEWLSLGFNSLMCLAGFPATSQ